MRRYVSPARASKFAANLGHSEDHVLYFRNTCESFLDATMPAGAQTWQCGPCVRMKMFLITAKLGRLPSKREEFLQEKSGTVHLDLRRWGGSPRDRRPRR
jgi:hypothetical protein